MANLLINYRIYLKFPVIFVTSTSRFFLSMMTHMEVALAVETNKAPQQTTRTQFVLQKEETAVTLDTQRF